MTVDEMIEKVRANSEPNNRQCLWGTALLRVLLSEIAGGAYFEEARIHLSEPKIDAEFLRLYQECKADPLKCSDPMVCPAHTVKLPGGRHS